MNVLSLFDGISCGRIALERAGIKVDNYYASELDDCPKGGKYAAIISKANYPDNIRMGDVTKWREWDIDWSTIDLLVGGSPCQGFSFAGKQLAFNDPRSALFFEYLNILNHIKAVNPNVKFMLENVKMKKEYLDLIDSMLGVNRLNINSNLVSAQNRQRYYWANWDFKAPDDKGLKLIDVLEGKKEIDTDYVKIKSKCLRVGGRGSKLGDKHEWDSPYTILRARGNNKGGIRSIDGKVGCITSSAWQYNIDVFDGLNKRRFSAIECERLQTVPDGYTDHVSESQRFKALGNGWTVDVIAHIFKGLK